MQSNRRFRGKTPYLILLVDLDTQKGEPTPDEALRVIGNPRHPRRPAGATRIGEAGRDRHPCGAWCSATWHPVLPCRNGRSTRQHGSPPRFWRYPQE